MEFLTGVKQTETVGIREILDILEGDGGGGLDRKSVVEGKSVN